MKTKLLFTLILAQFTCVSLFGQSLSVQSGAQLTIEPGAFVSSTDADIDGGTLVLNSDATNSGTFLSTGSVAVENSGTIKYNRYIPTTNWHMVSSPVTGQNVTSFASDTDNNLVTNGTKVAVGKYDNTKAVGTRWNYYDTSMPSGFDTEFASAEGYIIKVTTTDQIAFEGSYPTVNSSGNVEKTLETSSSHRWFAVGNPLPAYLPATRSGGEDNLLTANSILLDSNYTALYFWVGSEWEPINNLSDHFLPPGSGFMVKLAETEETVLRKSSFKSKLTSKVDETFIFPRSYQSSRSESESFNREGVTKQQIEVTLSRDNSIKKTTVYFHDQGTAKLDIGFDAAAYNQSNAKFGIRSRLLEEDQGIDFKIQTLPRYDYQNFVIPLAVYADKGKYALKAVTKNLPEDMTLYLEDRVKGITYTLNTAALNLKFDEKVMGTGRFFLANFPPEKMDDEEPLTKTIVPLNLYNMYSNTLKVVGSTPEVANHIEIYSFDGNKIYETDFYADDSYEFKLPEQILTGIYIAVLTDEQGKKVIKKITVQ